MYNLVDRISPTHSAKITIAGDAGDAAACGFEKPNGDHYYGVGLGATGEETDAAANRDKISGALTETARSRVKVQRTPIRRCVGSLVFSCSASSC